MLKFWSRRYSGSIMFAGLACAQLIVLGYQARTDRDIALPRRWVVNATAPVKKGLQRSGETVSGAWSRYFQRVDKGGESRELAAEMARLRLENQWLRQNVKRFDREAELVAYQREAAAQTVLARVVAGGSNPLAKELFLDRGEKHGIRAGMAVITADGIVGKVQACYASVSLVLLINDTESSAGIVLADSLARGVLKGTGGRACTIDYILPETKVSPGELAYTSGDDRVFPRGLPVGRVTRVAPGTAFQDISVELFAPPDLVEEALIVTKGVHLQLPGEGTPEAPGALTASQRQNEVDSTPAPGLSAAPVAALDADRIKQRYRETVGAQGTRIGNLGQPAPDFNFDPAALPPASPAPEASPSAAQEREKKPL